MPMNRPTAEQASDIAARKNFLLLNRSSVATAHELKNNHDSTHQTTNPQDSPPNKATRPSESSNVFVALEHWGQLLILDLHSFLNALKSPNNVGMCNFISHLPSSA